MKPNDVIRLKGKSLKGKNRVREHGELWVVRSIALDDSHFIKKGMLDIEPVEQRGRWPEGRWISPVRDKDFELIEVLNDNS